MGFDSSEQATHSNVILWKEVFYLNILKHTFNFFTFCAYQLSEESIKGLIRKLCYCSCEIHSHDPETKQDTPWHRKKNKSIQFDVIYKFDVLYKNRMLFILPYNCLNIP